MIQFLKRTLLPMMLVALLMLSAASPALAKEGVPSAKKTKTMYLKADTNLLKSAKSSAKPLQKLLKGDSVSVLSTKGDWARVSHGDVRGYVKKSKLTSKAPIVPDTSKYNTLRPGDKGEAVKALQTRLKALGWFGGSIGGNYLTQTTQAVTNFQGAANLTADGVADSDTQAALYAPNAPRFTVVGISTASPAKGAVHDADWWTSGIQQIFFRKSKAVVTDVMTGISFSVIRVGGSNHADCQPATAKDTAAMKTAYGGKWSWDRRAIWVSVGGKRYAASMNGMPHGGDSIKNNDFNGMFCIHFTNSKGHASDAVCPLHQAAIQLALSAG